MLFIKEELNEEGKPAHSLPVKENKKEKMCWFALSYEGRREWAWQREQIVRSGTAGGEGYVARKVKSNSEERGIKG